MLSQYLDHHFLQADCTLMEDPEDRLDEEILKGVALRPKVNSETNRAERKKQK